MGAVSIMNGIISRDEIEFVGHGLFQNFRLALKNYLNTEFKNVNDINDLKGIDVLYIIDEHFTPHVGIWKNDAFINEINQLNIRVVIFNFEKIHSAAFPWNIDHQRYVEKIKSLVQFVSDVNDPKIMGKVHINKQMLSKNTLLDTDPIGEKLDRILFLGQISPHVYVSRKEVLRKVIEKKLPVDIYDSDRKLTYKQYLTKIASYKYILNPLGTGEFINLRFYEAVRLGCIPIQQVTDEMLTRYSELKDNALYNFKSVDDIPLQVSPLVQDNQYSLEDYFEEINLKSYL